MGSRCIHLWILSVLFAIGCGGKTPGTPEDTPPAEDARLDGGTDSSTDAATDATTDGTTTDGTVVDAPPDTTVTDGQVIDTPPDTTVTPDSATPDSATPDATPDAPPPACPGTQIHCPAPAGTCTDTNFDPDNCGACGVDCGSNICSFGKCCPSGQTNCGGTCVDLDNGGANGTNCGACGTTCANGNACDAGKCCPTGQDNCSGTCRNTGADINNCGGCGIACPANNSCLSGTCCPTGQVNCNGVCVDLDNGGPGKQNCGACGTTCSASQTCEDGICCTTGQDLCNGVCTNTSNNDLNCGGCGINCGAGKVCSNSQCVANCISGQTLCNGVCINTSNDPANCGGCGTTCGGGKTCSNSACSCPASAPDTCSGLCVDKDTDPANCGACGTSCGAGNSCTDGKCCPNGQTNCNGTCVNLNTGGANGSNCGSCGNTCGAGSTCDQGSCECGFNQIDCNGECVTAAVDKDNCGSCGNTCNANEFCVSNGCIGTCPSPLVGCGGDCVNRDDDNNNCGGCGIKCLNGTGCSGGLCVPPVVLNPPPAGKCANGGPPINPFPGGGGGCTGQVAGVTFTFALCSCTDITTQAVISTDGFDSTQGPYVPGQNGAGVGVHNILSNNANTIVGGDLFSSRTAGLDLGDVHVRQRLFMDGALKFAKLLSVDEDAFIGGTITKQGPGQFFVTDQLKSPVCPAETADLQYGSCLVGPVDVAPPCDCTAPPSNNGKIDVRGIVTFHSIAANNDNASIGLSKAALDNPSGRVRLDLPCGKYYLNSINGSAPITIVAHGHTALFIGGSINPSQELIFDLDPTATLDIFVGGVMKASQDLTVGNPLYPRLTRMFFGSASTSGTGSCTSNSDCTSGICQGPTGNKSCSGGGNLTDAVQLSGSSFLNGLFYAGFGRLFHSNPLEMFGAIFAKNYDASSSTIIHFDRAAVDLAEECNEVPPTTCNDCGDCNNQACGVLGFCTSCTQDSDCCQPLRCNAGTCELIP